MEELEYLVVGAGPTGLGAATRLQECGKSWYLLEAEDGFGGLASSFVDGAGFTWDLGGHVQFSHYETFDRYMDSALGESGWFHHERESWVWIRDRFVPYPFQNNLHRLDGEDQWACVEGLLEAHNDSASARPEDFGGWMRATFGTGVTELFMRPYNWKVWAYPPETMNFKWIGERVAVPKLESVLRSICTGEDQVSWGPNSTFRFPKHGGTGAVWQSIGNSLPTERVELGTRVEAVDASKKIVTMTDESQVRYRYLISTMPLNHLVQQAEGVVDSAIVDKLSYSTTNVVGVGLEGRAPEHLRTKCWMYFPEANSPYYRVTVFSNYSPNNCPRPGQQWSLMAEVSESRHKPVDQGALTDDVLRALVEDGLVEDRDSVVSVTQRRIPQGYPTPFLSRDEVVDPILRAFEENDIYSRGRFGAWKYEVSNQDHSFAQGYECVDRLVNGGGAECEPTLHQPDVVNNRRNP